MTTTPAIFNMQRWLLPGPCCLDTELEISTSQVQFLGVFCRSGEITKPFWQCASVTGLEEPGPGGFYVSQLLVSEVL